MPTPARWAIFMVEAEDPSAVKTASAASRICARLRRASARNAVRWPACSAPGTAGSGDGSGGIATPVPPDLRTRRLTNGVGAPYNLSVVATPIVAQCDVGQQGCEVTYGRKCQSARGL